MTPDKGVLRRSEGKEADFGVWRGGSTGLLVAGILSTRTSDSSSERVTELPDDDSGVSDDGEGVEEAQVSREEGGRMVGGRAAISGTAHRLMLCLRCVGFSAASSYCLARRRMEQDLDRGGRWS